MSEEIVTTFGQQAEVYKALRGDPSALERWEAMMKMIGLSDGDIALIKGENE